MKRESFFALYWDHARDLPRMELCLLAGFSSNDFPTLMQTDWNALTEWERVELRLSILAALPLHDQVRAECVKSRQLRGEKVTA